ncbi:MAG: hypothetical protein SF187_27855 [Deltaproteobacteria bacterium]|nr:hypothetical protein [Deltaproteobacteria bacterium]
MKLSWTGKVPFEVHHIELTKRGFDLIFTKDVDVNTAADVAAYGVQHFFLSVLEDVWRFLARAYAGESAGRTCGR